MNTQSTVMKSLLELRMQSRYKHVLTILLIVSGPDVGTIKTDGTYVITLARYCGMTATAVRNAMVYLSQNGYIERKQGTITLTPHSWKDEPEKVEEDKVVDTRYSPFVEMYMQAHKDAGGRYIFTGKDGALLKGFLRHTPDSVEEMKRVVVNALGNKYLRQRADSIIHFVSNYSGLKLAVAPAKPEQGGGW